MSSNTTDLVSRADGIDPESSGEESWSLPEENSGRSGRAPAWVVKSFQFVSLAALTQVVLLLNQLVMLPIQIRTWGTEVTAYWYSTLAIAAVTTAADFGLRTAGHAELIRFAQNPENLKAKKEFLDLWAWIRILITATSVGLIVLDFAYNHLYLGASYPLWRSALLLGIAFEIFVVVRIVYLDSLGLYRDAEGGYLILASARLVLAVGALIFFRAPPATLAWIWFFTGIFTLVQQSRLCRRVGLLRLFEPIPSDLSFKTLAIARHTMADPCSNWVRIQGPVVILSIIAPPAAITTFVAMRAVFGAARTTIMQLSRYASVEYISLRHSQRTELAEIQLTLSVLLASLFASALAGVVIIDNARVASLVLSKVDPLLYQEMAVTFGLGSAFYCYQILQGVLRRSGEVARIARRQYHYMLYWAAFAVVAIISESTLLWLVLIMLADVIISFAFMLKTSKGSIQSQTTAGWRGCLASVISAFFVFGLWMIVHVGNFDFLSAKTGAAFAYSTAFFTLWTLLITAANVVIVSGLLAGKLNLTVSLLEKLRNSRAPKPQDD